MFINKPKIEIPYWAGPLFARSIERAHSMSIERLPWMNALTMQKDTTSSKLMERN